MGGPSAGKSRFGEFFQKAGKGFHKEVGFLNRFAPGVPGAFAQGIQQGKDYGTSLFNYANPVIQQQGYIDPRSQAGADIINEARAIVAPSGNPRTSPGAVAQELNYYDKTQQRLQTAAGLAQTGEALTIGPPAAATQAFLGLFDPLLSAASGASNINAQLATQSNIAGSNKNAALESAGIGVVGDLVKAVGSAGGIAAFASDERLKKNIRDTGKKTAEGIPIKTFEYKGGKRRFKGVMAQDVEKVHPEAVLTMPFTGHKMIDLEKVDVPFQALQLGGEVLPMPTLEDIYRLLPKKSPDPPPKKKEPKEQISGGGGYPEEPEKYQKGGATMKKKKKKKKYQEGGQSTDTVPAMLTPGEYVLNRGAVQLFRPQINAMNEIGKRHPIMRKNRGEQSSVRGGVLHAPVGGPTDPEGGTWVDPVEVRGFDPWEGQTPSINVPGGDDPRGVGGIAPPSLFGGPGIGPGGEPREPRGGPGLPGGPHGERGIGPFHHHQPGGTGPSPIGWIVPKWFLPGGPFNPLPGNPPSGTPGGGGPRGHPFDEPGRFFRPRGGGRFSRQWGGPIYYGG